MKSVSEGVSRECVSVVFNGEMVHIVFINELNINYILIKSMQYNTCLRTFIGYL